MADKIWYIEVNGTKEGPYSFYDLKRDSRITPDTLIWKQGYSKWVRIREVWELRDLFKDEEPSEPFFENKQNFEKVKEGGALTLEAPWFQPPFLIYLLLLSLVCYFLYRLFLS